MASLPGSSSESPPPFPRSPVTTINEEASYEDPITNVIEELLSQTPVVELPTEIPLEGGPPVGPDSAYAPPDPATANPLRATKDVPEALKVDREKPMYGVYVTSTRNNTIATFTRPNGNPVARFTGGKCGFKGQRRNSFEAGYKCAVETFNVIKEEELKVGGLRLTLNLSGFGQGRDATMKALMAAEGQDVRQWVTHLTDRTPIKIGGTRAKKMRR